MAGTVHQRQQKTNKSNEEEKKMARRHVKSFPGRSYKSYMFYGIILSVTLFVFVYQWLFSSYKVSTLDAIGYNLGLHSNVYAVIIDAGSTGSRVMALSFYKSGFDGSLKLEKDLFYQNKPGLSSFAENPQKAVAKIEHLLEKAKNFIPKDAWSETPVALKATAGLRLLPSDKAQNLLKKVRTVIDECPFSSNEQSVSIMDGKDEGLFLWFTVNFLLDHLNGDITQSVATLDLGGGSVQITFIPNENKRIVTEVPGHLYKVSIMNKKVETYSYSYLGLGLMAARRRIFLAENLENATDILSSCIHPEIVNKKWKYGGTEFSVRGNKEHNLQKNVVKCFDIAKEIVQEGNMDKPKEIFKRQIIAFSYFFDKAAEVGLIDPYDGGSVTVRDFFSVANNTCFSMNSEQPFMCLDFIFMSNLLLFGFGLTADTTITLLDTIDGHEISWALGAAYRLLEEKYSS